LRISVLNFKKSGLKEIILKDILSGKDKCAWIIWSWVLRQDPLVFKQFCQSIFFGFETVASDNERSRLVE